VSRVRSLRTSNYQLALLYAGLFTASILVLFALTYRTAADYAAQDEAAEIDVEFVAIEDEARLAGDEHLPQIIGDHLRQRSGEHAAYLLQDAQGQRLAGNIPARAPRLGPQLLQLEVDGAPRELRAHGYRLANGDYVLIGKYAGSEITLDGEEYVILREEEILGVAEGVREPETVGV